MTSTCYTIKTVRFLLVVTTVVSIYAFMFYLTLTLPKDDEDDDDHHHHNCSHHFNCSQKISKYVSVLKKSILFYEAQRSGKLDERANRVSWRGDSFLHDFGQNGEDLTGGYFDGGGFVKYMYPMAGAMTLLAWGLLDHRRGYEVAGELQNGLAGLKWGTDFLIKAHPSENEFYFQIGDPIEDQEYWGRPEEWPFSSRRPTFRLTIDQPGSDVAGEAAAALAAASLVFMENGESNYGQRLLKHARQLYNFANNYRKKYTDSFPQTKTGAYYNSTSTSSNFGDELGYAAAWLYRATNEKSYLTHFQSHWLEFDLDKKSTRVSWDCKVAMLQVLMAQIDGSKKYKEAAKSFCDWLISSVPKTPKGLSFLSDPPNLGETANAAFICMMQAEAGGRSEKNVYVHFAQKQIDYMLGTVHQGQGDGQSFVAGFGDNYPRRPHHASSSCDNFPAKCDWTDYTKMEPNGHVLIGGLVGGPNVNDTYKDDRQDDIGNGVSLGQNAGFQSTLAAFVDLEC